MNLNHFFSNPRNIIITLLLFLLPSLGFNLKDIIKSPLVQTEPQQETIKKRFNIVVRDKDKQPIKDVKVQWLYCDIPGFEPTEDNGSASISLKENCPASILLTLTKDNYEIKNVKLDLESIAEGEIKIIYLEDKKSTKNSSNPEEKEPIKTIDGQTITVVVKQDPTESEPKPKDIEKPVPTEPKPKTFNPTSEQAYKIQYFKKSSDKNAENIAMVLKQSGFNFEIGEVENDCPISHIWYGTKVNQNEALNIAKSLESINVKTMVEPFPAGSSHTNKALIQIGAVSLDYGNGIFECT